MKLALAYSTKDSVELTEQTILSLLDHTSEVDIHWVDGSVTPEGQRLAAKYRRSKFSFHAQICGGADAAIAYKLSKLLNAPNKCSYIGLIENDVLLDHDWLAPTLELFHKGERDGLTVGAVSARSYVDRVLIQREGYAVMHNCGAGHIIFTREAAEIVLRSFRTHWWPDNVRLFAQLAGIDLRTFACFGGQEQFVTTDWGWEAQLARHGLATLALTPSKASMIGQVPPLHEQGLTLTTGPVEERRDNHAFKRYVGNLQLLRKGLLNLDGPDIIHRHSGGMLFFPHQMEHLPGSTWRGTLELKWSQGFGPFAYRAGAGGASLFARVSGSCSFLCSGGDAGASVAVTDTRSGFKAEPELPPEQGAFVEIAVPGGPVPRVIEMKLSEGAVFYGLQTSDPQILDTSFRFDWHQLPKAG